MSGFGVLSRTVADLRDEDIPSIIRRAWERVRDSFPAAEPEPPEPARRGRAARVAQADYPAVLDRLRQGARMELLAKEYRIGVARMGEIAVKAGWTQEDRRLARRLRKALGA